MVIFWRGRLSASCCYFTSQLVYCRRSAVKSWISVLLPSGCLHRAWNSFLIGQSHTHTSSLWAAATCSYSSSDDTGNRIKMLRLQHGLESCANVQIKSQILKKKKHVCKDRCAVDESSHHFLIQRRDPIKILYSSCLQSVYNDPCHITFIFPFMCILCFQLRYLMSTGLPVYGVVGPKVLWSTSMFMVWPVVTPQARVCARWRQKLRGPEMLTPLVNWTFYQADAATKFPIRAWWYFYIVM